MNRQLAWDDLRLILAVAVEGTLSGAGRRLGLSHATVFRHLGEIEERLGAKLFDRGRKGYTPTAAGEEAAAAARRIESEVLDVERRFAGQDLRPSGTVRLTTTDTLLAGLLSPILRDFRKAHSDIRVEISVSNQLFSLTRREADVAIRPSPSPPETLVGRRIGTIAQAIYGRDDLCPADGGEIDIHAKEWIGPDEGMAYASLERWMADQGLDARCRYRVDTLFGMFAAVRDGAGLAVLPCYLGDSDKRLVRIGGTIPSLATDLWLLTHPDLRKTARIRALLDFIADAMKCHRAQLAGTV
ncbi:LysR family transcriptional regulator [Ferruginivarius sediminum]|uniref:LysR family transcriptional regulator n=1 Tax=Ferruginivarius sediminum TaxID=2661937 RepID=A0A369TDU6_9PROT|nr:LysR family transcriptional regulator [Ferruginivarius sediminum]RDD61096.1 LysR family transcriptional regulator [Ferruginivarius sediminum]